ncbi:type I-E CRISPR-associated protein Cse2/CasB [Rothia sp. CCM 9418]|uniref:type I-E CRISPR-associated protein Cse2/CasB n=1 Tax=Rothia sp. CCM 9418 TaxID=3402661 RepID=UPI003AE9C16A
MAQQSYNSLLNFTLRVRGPQSNSKKAWSALRKGLVPTLEHYAYPYVLPHLESTNDQTATLRAIGLIAEFKDIPAQKPDKDGKYQWKSVGTWAAEVSRALANNKNIEVNPNTKNIELSPDNPDRIGQLLAYLHTQNLEEAVRTLYRIMHMTKNLNNVPAMHFGALINVLTYWGNGISEESREHRLTLIRDYYSAVFPKKEKTEETEA